MQSNGGDTRDRIFQVAAQLFAQKGYNGVSVREISEGSGVSKPMIYYYFGNKEGVYRALVQAGIEHGQTELARIRLKNLTLRDELVEIVRWKFRDCIEFPEFAKFFISIYMSLENLPFLAEYRQTSIESQMNLVKILQRGIETGDLKQDVDLELVSELLIAMLIYHLWRFIETKNQDDDDGLAEKLVDTLLDGIKNDKK